MEMSRDNDQIKKEAPDLKMPLTMTKKCVYK